MELKRASHAIRPTPHNDKWCQETDHLEFVSKFIGVPNLTVFDFECLTTTGLDVDLSESLTTDLFSWIEHTAVPTVGGFRGAGTRPA